MKYPIISTRDLSLLPDVTTLKHITQSMSVICEILLYPITDFPPDYYILVYPDKDYLTAHMDNTQADRWHILFNSTGAVMVGSFHEAEMAPWGPHCGEVWPNMYTGLPVEFKEIFNIPFFEAAEAATFCIWRKYSDPVWNRGPVKFPFREGDTSGISFLNESADIIHDYLDGSAEALSRLDGNPERFWEWVIEYADDPDSPHDIPLSVIEDIFRHKPLTQAMIEALKPGLKLESIRETLIQTGYPLAE